MNIKEEMAQNEMAQKARFSDMKRLYWKKLQEVSDAETLCNMIKSVVVGSILQQTMR